jgi:hypothetical protein
MSELVHEIWEFTENGMILHACCLAGLRGEEQRRYLGDQSRLLTTFRAANHFDAMTFYHRYLGREAYTTPYEQDHLPYPAEWWQGQLSAGE